VFEEENTGRIAVVLEEEVVVVGGGGWWWWLVVVVGVGLVRMTRTNRTLARAG
jgi:hypothetical protein